MLSLLTSAISHPVITFSVCLNPTRGVLDFTILRLKLMCHQTFVTSLFHVFLQRKFFHATLQKRKIFSVGKQKDHSFSTFAKFFEKLIFLIPWYTHKVWNRCFPVNFAKFLRAPFFTEHLWTRASERSYESVFNAYSFHFLWYTLWGFVKKRRM